MFELFKKKKPEDWRGSNKTRWITTKETDTHILQKQQDEWIDMNSGNISWQDNYIHRARLPKRLIERLIDKRVDNTIPIKTEFPELIYEQEGDIN